MGHAESGANEIQRVRVDDVGVNGHKAKEQCTALLIHLRREVIRAHHDP